ncbi:MAG: hypothetical protein DRO39_09300 [Thermoprotei archaeon]|nr:MAG: hypothetical protein DRO39_09300 [Thermoprotei archaeon]
MCPEEPTLASCWAGAMRVVSVGFPASGVALGGIGTGSIEIRPDGRLYEWLIFNNKPWSGYGEPEFPMGPDDLVFALRARAPGEEPVVRLLQTGIWRDREGLCASYRSCGGCVIDPYHTPWVRGVERIEFDGRPPIARLRYADSAFDELGLCVELEAFSPIIPGNLRSSSLPVAVFRFRLRNISRHRLELALMALSKNPFSSVEGSIPKNRGVQTGEFTGIEFLGEGVSPHHGMYRGSMAMGFVGGADSLASFLVSGERGAVEVIRRVLVDFRGDGVVEGSPDAQGPGELYGVVTRRVSLGPGEEAEVTLVLAWFFPNHVDYKARVLGHYYENMFSSAVEVAGYVSKHVDLLRERVRAFVDAIYDATYPEWIKDLVSSQVSTLAKSTWLTREGVFAVWEGGPGCCGLNTVDVALWGFVGVALLFPDLVRRAVEHIASLILEPGKSPFYEIYALAFPENMRLYRELLARDPSIQHDVEKFRRAVKSIVEKTGRDPRGRVPHLLHGTIDRVDGYDRVDLMPEFLLLVALVYRWTGDVGFLKRLWPRVKEVVDAVLRQHDDAGLKLPYHAPPSG